ncbi:MAG: hypothetical protein ACFFF9_11800 [Candidatus Thorarchaeota archaeon]
MTPENSKLIVDFNDRVGLIWFSGLLVKVPAYRDAVCTTFAEIRQNLVYSGKKTDSIWTRLQEGLLAVNYR